MLSALEQRRARELGAQVATLAENPTLKAAVDTYQPRSASANAAFRREMLATVERELEKLAARIAPDVLAVTDASGQRPRRRRAAAAPTGRCRHACTRALTTRRAVRSSPPTGVFQFARRRSHCRTRDRDRCSSPRRSTTATRRTVDAVWRGDAHRQQRPVIASTLPPDGVAGADAGGAALAAARRTSSARTRPSTRSGCSSRTARLRSTRSTRSTRRRAAR